MFNKIKRKELEARALTMRSALDQIEGALMGFDELQDQIPLWANVGGADVRVKLNISVGQLRRIASALVPCNTIVNSEDYAPSLFGYKEPT